MHQATNEQIDYARKFYSDDTVQVDDNATAADAEDGAWISAWVWVPCKSPAPEPSPQLELFPWNPKSSPPTS